MNDWTLLIIILITVGVHEVGHAITYWMFGKKPTLKFHNGVILIGDNVFRELTPLQALFVLSMGMFVGYWYLALLISDKAILMAYWVLCSIDISTFFGILGWIKDKRTIGALLKEDAIKTYNLREL